MVTCGVLLLVIVITVATSLVPDEVEAVAYEKLAAMAAENKRQLIASSPLVLELEAENARLHDELRTLHLACDLEPPGVIERGWDWAKAKAMFWR